MFNLIGLVVAFFGVGLSIASFFEPKISIVLALSIAVIGLLIDYIAFRRRIMYLKKMREKNAKKK